MGEHQTTGINTIFVQSSENFIRFKYLIGGLLTDMHFIKDDFT